MTKLTSDFIKGLMKEYGTDLVGIASVDRFQGAPPGHGSLFRIYLQQALQTGYP